jgi:hypothetical protein
LPNSERIFALETKIIRIMVGAKSNISGWSIFRDHTLTSSTWIYIFISELPSWITRSILKQIQRYTVIKQELRIVFIGQLPTFLASKKVHFMLITFFIYNLTCHLMSFINKRAQYEVAFERYLNIQCFNSTGEYV